MDKVFTEKEYFTLFTSLLKLISENPEITIEQAVHTLSDEYSVEMIQESIVYLLSKEFLDVVNTSKQFDNQKLILAKIPEIDLNNRGDKLYPKILLSLPSFNFFGLESELSSLNGIFYNMKDEFKLLFENAEKTIYICSPFLEFKGISEFLSILIPKAKSGVDIKIISREINKSKNKFNEMKKIYSQFNSKNANIEIRDYYYEFNFKLASSVHAKLIITDNKLAYIGSGELRENSFEKNFESGVIINGNKAHQIGLIFEKIFSLSTIVDWGD
ncbi:phospholipase D-like domain-containing protein [uncultured Methanobacterium sp.]|uniref:phospholipase D-like domain-containing protein n=1 Tax=uncultured Methanobacterium sp. TaxID=176306 RepID=UPI002AA73A9D|nr:phospholipase D-like domain-containing protein [uncultured Methanobacterium sp.]